MRPISPFPRLAVVALLAACLAAAPVRAASRAALAAFHDDFTNCVAARVLYRASVGSDADEAAALAVDDCDESLRAIRALVAELGLQGSYDERYFERLRQGTRQAAADYAREHDVRNRDFQ